MRDPAKQYVGKSLVDSDCVVLPFHQLSYQPQALWTCVLNNYLKAAITGADKICPEVSKEFLYLRDKYGDVDFATNVQKFNAIQAEIAKLCKQCGDIAGHEQPPAKPKEKSSGFSAGHAIALGVVGLGAYLLWKSKE